MKEYVKPVAELIIFDHSVLAASACRCYADAGVENDYATDWNCYTATYSADELTMVDSGF